MLSGLLGILFIAALGWAIVQGGRFLTGQSEAQRLGGRGDPGGHRLGPGRRDPQASGAAERSETEEVHSRTGDMRAGQPTPSFTQQLSPLAQREEKINQLRRRYVSDEISVEQYEAELDRLMRE
jgi:hypothetical protein